MAPHSSTFAWRIPWTQEPGGLQSMGSLESDMTEQFHFHFSLSYIGEGNSNPLHCSCLENPRDGEAWWAAVYGVTQSQTRLKRLNSMCSLSQESAFPRQSGWHHSGFMVRKPGKESGDESCSLSSFSPSLLSPTIFHSVYIV